MARRLGGYAKFFGKRSLIIKYQPVFPPPREIVQSDTEVLQVRLMAMCEACFAMSDEPAFCEIPPGVTQSRSTADPQNILHIVQAAGALFQIRFKVISRVMVSAMTLLLLKLLRHEKCAWLKRSLHRTRKFPEQSAGSGKLTGLKQAGLYRNILCCLFQAFGESTN